MPILQENVVKQIDNLKLLQELFTQKNKNKISPTSAPIDNMRYELYDIGKIEVIVVKRVNI